MGAATIYGVGKTFLWPTMLGVVGERFPKGGALTMGAMGGVGMLSAGLLGGPGIGYTQDVNATAKLEEIDAGRLRGSEVGRSEPLLVLSAGRGLRRHEGRRACPKNSPEFEEVKEASDYGGQLALKITAAIPATMAVGYLFLLIYFRAIGGYKLVEIGPGGEEHETGHVPTAKEAIYIDSQADQA